MSNPPPGTPQPHRRRRRDLSGTPIAILAMLMRVPRGHLDPDLAAIACQTNRQTVIQAIHRLRDQGLVIITHPCPPGPMRVQWYMLHHESRRKAWELLSWWAENRPDIWARYKKMLSQEEPTHDPNTPPSQPTKPQPGFDPATYWIHDIDTAHADALLDNEFRW